MKQRPAILIFVSLLVALLLSACSTDTLPVLQDVVQGQADKLVIDAIGEIQIMQTKAKLAVENATAEIPRLQLVEAEERAEVALLDRKITELQESSNSLGQLLLKLADLLEAGEPYTSTVSGRVISIQELRTYAETQKVQYQEVQARLTTMQESKQIRLTNAENAHSQWTAAEQAVQLLKAKQQLLNAKITQLELLKSQAASTTGTVSIDSALVDARNVLSEATDEIDKQILVTEQLSSFKAKAVQDVDLSQELLGNTGGGDDTFANDLRDLVTGPDK